MASPVLRPDQRKQLRALSHHLEPVVRVGKSGVTDPVVAAVSDALVAHELIKVRLYDPEQKRAMADELATRTEAALCGLLGHTVILYRKHPKRPRIVLEPERAKRSEGEAITTGSASRSRSRARPRKRKAR